eukprot:TRINITY_DN2734_c0_g1_i1.p1 TRINITY_DN2734_c0_g1~~TRINITY_DN2734_c0_g1_i1.p1  ORF type:complete len:290 (-),score=26.82 TRINITY_DN2734_c0_g1_i1:749-1618(-)
MDGKERNLPSYIEFDGFKVPAAYNIENLKSALKYQAQAEDIFVCTYPKCGTTWMTYIVYLIMHNGDPLPEGEELYKHVPFLEKHGKEAVEKLAFPRVIKTHFPYDRVPKSQKAKYIYVARNPKDCVVSFFHHTQGFASYFYENGNFDDYFEIFMEGEVDFGDYFQSLLSWHPHLRDPNVLFLSYEELKKDPIAGIKKVAEFLGEQYAENIKDEIILQKVVQNSDIKQMKNGSRNWVDTKRHDNSHDFLRKGESGGWKSMLSVEQSHRIDKKFKESMQGTIYEHLWDEYM